MSGYASASVTQPNYVTTDAAGMTATCTIRNALAKGPSIGAWVMMPGTIIARTMATLGFDWILVDAEHGNLQDSDWHDTVNAIAPWGPSPIIRLPGHTDWLVKRALDTGAHGIMVPMVNTKEQAEAIVRAAKFPPQGSRGHGGLFLQAAWKTSIGEYNAQANAHTFVIVQIETKEAVDNVDAIASVPGVDLLFVGPNDLAASLGLPPQSEDNSPIVLEALEKIKAAAKKHGKHTGIWANDGPMAVRRIEQGFEMVAVGCDLMAVIGYYSEHLKQAKDAAKPLTKA